MVNNTMIIAFTGTLTVLTAFVPAVAAEIACPSSILVKESLGQTPPNDWTPHAATFPRNLSGISFFDGPIENDVSIAPQRDYPVKKRGVRIAVWNFGKNPSPVWLLCRYADTGVGLAKELASTNQECRVAYGPGGIVHSIECR